MAHFADTEPAELDPRLLPAHSRPPADDEAHELAAAAIDARLAALYSEGFKDAAVLSLMVSHAGGYHRLMRAVSPERWHELVQRYPGLASFGALLVRARARI